MKTCMCFGLGVLMVVAAEQGGGMPGASQKLALPAPILEGRMSLEQAIAQRRSVRQFGEQRLTIKEIGQLCWAGQGITDPKHGFRASPSAGALFPIELYVVTAEGVDHYLPAKHELERQLVGDHRKDLHEAAGQATVGAAPVCVVIAAEIERTARKYCERAERYCWMEAGHVAQNILLQATALNLAGVPVGAYDDARVAEVLKLPKGWRILYLLPIGHRQ